MFKPAKLMCLLLSAFLVLLLAGAILAESIAQTKPSPEEKTPLNSQPLALRLYTLNTELDSLKQDQEDLSILMKEWRPFYKRLSSAVDATQFKQSEFADISKIITELAAKSATLDQQNAVKEFELLVGKYEEVSFGFDVSNLSPLKARDLARFEDEFESWKDSRFIEQGVLSELTTKYTELQKLVNAPPADLVSSAEVCEKFVILKTDADNFFANFNDLISKCSANLTKIGASYQGQMSALGELMKLTREAIEKLNTSLIAISVDVRAKIKDTNEKLFRLQQVDATASNKIIDQSAIDVISNTLLAWMAIIVMVIVAIITLTWFKFKYAGNQQQNSEFSFTLFLEMMTVFLLTGAILILGLAAKIDNQGLAALIGGISGYVLGRMRSGTQAGEGYQGSAVAPAQQPVQPARQI